MNLKALLPIDHRKLRTKLSPKEVKEKLLDLLRNSRYKSDFLIWDTRPMRFEGEVLDNSFEISRKPTGSRSILAEVKGQVSTQMGKTLIDMKLRPVLLDRIFIIAWLVVSGLLCIGILLKIIDLNSFFPEFNSSSNRFPFLAFAFVSVFTIIGFKLESQKVRKFLEQLLEAEQFDLN